MELGGGGVAPWPTIRPITIVLKENDYSFLDVNTNAQTTRTDGTACTNVNASIIVHVPLTRVSASARRDTKG